MDFSERIKTLRIEKNLSQTDFAKKIECSQSALAKWERKKTQPTAENLISIAKFCFVAVDYILGLTEDDTPHWDIDVTDTVSRTPLVTRSFPAAARSRDGSRITSMELTPEEQQELLDEKAKQFGK